MGALGPPTGNLGVGGTSEVRIFMKLAQDLAPSALFIYLFMHQNKLR